MELLADAKWFMDVEGARAARDPGQGAGGRARQVPPVSLGKA
jgi:hypothetical protein